MYENFEPTVAVDSAAGGTRNWSATVAEEPMGTWAGGLETTAAENDSLPKVRMRGNDVCGAASNGPMSVTGVRLTRTWAAECIAV